MDEDAGNHQHFLPHFCLKASFGEAASESRGILHIQASHRKFFPKFLFSQLRARPKGGSHKNMGLQKEGLRRQACPKLRRPRIQRGTKICQNTKTQGTPRFTKTQGTPRFTKIQGTPRFKKTQGTPRFAKTQGTPRNEREYTRALSNTLGHHGPDIGNISVKLKNFLPTVLKIRSVYIVLYTNTESHLPDVSSLTNKPIQHYHQCQRQHHKKIRRQHLGLKYILYVWNRKDCSIASPGSGDNNQKKTVRVGF